MSYVYSSGERCYIGDISDIKPNGLLNDRLIEIDNANNLKNVYTHDGSTWAFQGATENYEEQGMDIVARAMSIKNSATLIDIANKVSDVENTIDTAKFSYIGCSMSLDANMNLKISNTDASITYKQIYVNKPKLDIKITDAFWHTYVIIAGNNNDFCVMNLKPDTFGILYRLTNTAIGSSQQAISPTLYPTNYDYFEFVADGKNLSLYYSYNGNTNLISTIDITVYFSGVYSSVNLGIAGFSLDNNVVTLYNQNIFSKFALKTDVSLVPNVWKGKAGNALGDSQTVYGYYLPHVMNILGLSAYNNYGVSGTTIAEQTSGDTNAFCNRYTSMGSANLVTVFGGTNDFGKSIPLGNASSTDKTTFYGGLKALCDGLLSKYPSNRIFFINIPQRDWLGGGQVAGIGANGVGATLEDYNTAIKTICRLYSIPVIDLFGESGICLANISTWTLDRLHFNQLGGERIGNQIGLFISEYSL